MIELLEFVAGYFLADALTGVAHFIGDRTWLGSSKLFATFNVEHHAKPLYIVNQSLIARNLTTMFGVILIGGAVYAVFGFSFFWLGLIVGGSLVSEVHRWAHAPRTAPRAVRLLQWLGLFQSPKHHAGHHKPPHSVRFCLLTDWLNAIIDPCFR